MIRSVEKDSPVVKYDSYNKILYYFDINAYKWSKAIFTGAKARNAIGDTPLDGLIFSFCDSKKDIVLKVSNDDENKILDFLKENHLTIVPIVKSETSEKTRLIVKQG